MNKTYDWIVIGGGFRSMVAAYALAKSGNTVAIVERARTLGGFLSPIKWGEFWIDKGPQFFDNFESNDVEFFNEMIETGHLQDIGFSYSSYMNGKKTDGFAIPDWRSFGAEFSRNTFVELLQLQLDRRDQGVAPAEPDSLAELIALDGGEALSGPLHGFCEKFLRQPASKLNVRAGSLVSFLGRKLLFDQDTSLDLKKSPLIDDFLAAQKVQVGETRYNLYPKGNSLENVRLAMVQALERSGVETLLETAVTDIDIAANELQTNSGNFGFGHLFWGCDIRDTEAALSKDTPIMANTHILPEIFHCFVVPADKVDDALYMVDYDCNHLSVRMTNFCNYMGHTDEDGNGVICVEQPIDINSAEWENPEKDREQIFAETIETGNLAQTEYKMAHSFRIPSTYKVPKKGINTHVDKFLHELNARHGDKLIIPDPYTLTRKQVLDNLRELQII